MLHAVLWDLQGQRGQHLYRAFGVLKLDVRGKPREPINMRDACHVLAVVVKQGI